MAHLTGNLIQHHHRINGSDVPDNFAKQLIAYCLMRRE